jgi:hypothetical protein
MIKKAQQQLRDILVEMVNLACVGGSNTCTLSMTAGTTAGQFPFTPFFPAPPLPVSFLQMLKYLKDFVL